MERARVRSAPERSTGLWAILFVSNWRNSFGAGTFGDMVHLWSVAMEMQWYLVAPLIVYLLHRFVRRTEWIITILLAAVTTRRARALLGMACVG